MAKRFVDTDKYKKPFIRSLEAPYKLLWDYICLDCNHAGIWIVDFEVACIRLGIKITKEQALQSFNKKEEKIIVFDDGLKWFIKDFIPFQYGELNEKNRVHNSVLFELKKYHLQNGNKPLRSPLEGAKDKDKDKDKEKDKEKEKKKYSEFVFLTEYEYKKLVDKFGSEKTLEYIERLNNYIGSKGKRYKSHYHTILNWARRETTNGRETVSGQVRGAKKEVGIPGRYDQNRIVVNTDEF